MAVRSDEAPSAEGKAVGVTAVLATTAAIGACVLCCTLPVAFPAAALALLGGGVAFLGFAHKAMTLLGLVAVLAAWGWVWLQSRRSGRRPARLTIQLTGVATALLALALAWPLVEAPLLALIRLSACAAGRRPPRAERATGGRTKERSVWWLYFAFAAVAEIAGCFAFWAWLRLGKSPLWLAPAMVSLALFAF